jgi:queuine tRNA-ribosyltransferase
MFDCVLPTRSGRHGQAWTWAGPINVTNAKFAEDLSPLDEAVDCPASREFTRAYLHHLFKAGESLGPMVLSWHNTAFFQALMQEIRASIAEGRFDALCTELSARWAATRSAAKTA